MKDSKVLKKLYKTYLSNYKFKLFISCVLALASGIFLAYGPKKIGNLTTIIYEGIVKKAYGTGEIDFSIINNIFIVTLIIYLIAILFMLIEERIITNIVQKCMLKIKNDIFKKITKAQFSAIEKNTNVNNIYNEVDGLNKYLNIIFGQFLILISVIIGSIYFAFTINYILAMITLLLFPLLAIVLKIISQRYNKKMENNIENQNNLEDKISEIVYKNKLIHILDSKNRIIKNLERTNEKANITNKSCRKTIMQVECFSSLVGNIELVAILVVGIYLNSLNMISIGDIQSFLLYNKLIERPVFVISKISNVFYAIKDSLNKIFAFLDIEEEHNEGTLKFLNGDIDINELNFSYDNKINVLENINLKINEGKNVAIVGRTGAGKSTLLKLLLRFYNNYSGNISIGNTNIKDIDLFELRNSIGIVYQDTWIFSGTIMENITYGNENIEDENIIDICKKIGLHDYIEMMPDKYYAKIDEDASNISLGIKQLICIARLMLKNPKIVLLDEATNMLDYETEEIVRNALEKFLKDRTCIILAHRLSTIKNSDCIIVINNGQIEEMGTHDELLNNKKYYYKMYKNL